MRLVSANPVKEQAPMIKPIETRYRGFRFRSRLEARWAVFWDALRIPWVYEKEGYRLPYGDYLPDFFLPDPIEGFPDAGCWVEIKGAEPTPTERMLLEQLTHLTHHNAFLMHGLPMEHLVYHIGHHEAEGDWLRAPEVAGSVRDIPNEWYGLKMLLTRYMHIQPGMMQQAIEAARGARFEHGEQGRRG